MKISDFLGYGQSEAVPLKHLVTLTKLSEREVRLQIERERRAGELIISDNRHGYFLAETKEDADRFVKSMRKRANEILTTAASVEKAANIESR